MGSNKLERRLTKYTKCDKVETQNNYNKGDYNMSKMSQLHAELSEQASELGFESLGEAEQAGYEVDWSTGKLVEPQELAHKAWLEEREEVLGELISIYNDIDVPRDLKKYIKHAIEFVKKGEM